MMAREEMRAALRRMKEWKSEGNSKLKDYDDAVQAVGSVVQQMLGKGVKIEDVRAYARQEYRKEWERLCKDALSTVGVRGGDK